MNLISSQLRYLYIKFSDEFPCDQNTLQTTFPRDVEIVTTAIDNILAAVKAASSVIQNFKDKKSLLEVKDFEYCDTYHQKVYKDDKTNGYSLTLNFDNEGIRTWNESRKRSELLYFSYGTYL